MSHGRIMLALSAVVALLFAGSLVTGVADVSPWESLRALVIDDGTPLPLVMREIRLPRAILGVLVGVIITRPAYGKIIMAILSRKDA